MKTFNLKVVLEDDSLCEGCPARDEQMLNYCLASSSRMIEGVFRPKWCPLVPRVEAKLELTPLTPEELAEYQKDMEKES
jgi:hypothetical protein